MLNLKHKKLLKMRVSVRKQKHNEKLKKKRQRKRLQKKPKKKKQIAHLPLRDVQSAYHLVGLSPFIALHYFTTIFLPLTM